MSKLAVNIKGIICFVLLLATATNTSAQTASDSILTIAEQMPYYPGGTDSLLKEITKNVVYPQICADSNIQGKVYLRFVVNTDGSVTDLQAIKSPHPAMSVAAMDAVLKIGKFIPGMQNRKPVRVWYSLPVTFKVKVVDTLVAELGSKNPGLADTLRQIAKELEEQNIFKFVEQSPEFPGGDVALIKFIQQNIRYPVYERDRDIGGKVLTRFVVNEDGTVSDVQIMSGISPGLDGEAKRVLKMLPKFKPGIEQGKPVKVYFNLPVVFRTDASDRRKDLFEYYKGGFSAFYSLVESNLSYPARALSDNMEARISAKCILTNELKLEPIEVLNDIDSIFTFEAIRLMKLAAPFSEETRQSIWIKDTMIITVEFIFDKRHRWGGSGNFTDEKTAKRFTDQGAVYFRAGEYDKSMEQFNAAIRVCSVYSDAFFNRAVTEFKKGDKDGACDDFKRAYLLGALDAKQGIILNCSSIK